MHQPGIGHLGAVQIEIDQVFQSGEMSQSGISDRGLSQVELLQGDEASQMLEAVVGDLRSGQIDPGNLRQFGDRGEMLVGDVFVGQVERDLQPIVVLGDRHHVPSQRPERFDGLLLLGGHFFTVVRDSPRRQQGDGQNCCQEP